MSNNNSLTLIKHSLESIFIDNLQLKLIQAGANLELFIKDDILNIVIEVPKTLVSSQIEIETKMKETLSKQFNQFKDARFIFSSKNEEPPKKVKHRIPNVKKIILTAAAKGGVGKSTTAVNLAKALTKLGFKIGIVDADIYGPTIPKLLGINQKPETESGKMLPIFKEDIYSISIGYIVDDSKAAIWRGPMISKALYQLLLGVIWPELDYMIIDMPPGTGDIYLSLAENFIIDGAILVTTPQDIAISMLKKSISFFNKTNIPIMGVIKNMSYFIDSNNYKHYIFGENKSIDEFNLLGEIPISSKISKFSDEGQDLSKEKEFIAYEKIAKRLII